MNKQEFENRVHLSVSVTEYDAIEKVYMNSDLDKDEFCNFWCKMNKSRINKAKAEAKEAEKKQALREKVWNLYEKSQTLADMESFRILADNFFTETQKNLLETIGIKMQEEPQWSNNYVTRFKTVSTVRYELHQYLHAA